jgi:hypothetical protein
LHPAASKEQITKSRDKQQENSKMAHNVGNSDRVIRFVLGLLIIAAGLYFQSWFGLLAIVPLGTALIGFCPLYRIFGLSTCPVKAS